MARKRNLSPANLDVTARITAAANQNPAGLGTFSCNPPLAARVLQPIWLSRPRKSCSVCTESETAEESRTHRKNTTGAFLVAAKAAAEPLSGLNFPKTDGFSRKCCSSAATRF